MAEPYLILSHSKKVLNRNNFLNFCNFGSMKRMLLKIPRWWLSGVVFVAIVYLTLTPNPLPPDVLPDFDGFDKLCHFAMFGVLASLLVWDYSRGRRLSWRAAVMLICVSMAIGGVIELLQGIPELNRSCDIYDFVANVAGVRWC